MASSISLLTFEAHRSIICTLAEMVMLLESLPFCLDVTEERDLLGIFEGPLSALPPVTLIQYQAMETLRRTIVE